MSSARFIVGDVFETMAKMPDNSVDLIVTSPPFLALRSYLPAGHPDKGKEIGSEPTPVAFLSTLLALTREWRRILTPTGSLCVELGDTYSGGKAETRTDVADGSRRWGGIDGAPTLTGFRGGTVDRSGTGWPLEKSLCLLSTLYPACLAYGRNLLQPDDQIEPWRVRNLIVWHRPNPPVGALGDKVRPSTSYVTVACTAKDRWFDLDSERTEHKADPARYTGNGYTKGKPEGVPGNEAMPGNPAGAPPLDCWFEDRLAQSDEPFDVPDADVWTIPTAPYAGAHYATFPPALPRRLINLMCPRQVCRECGEPRRRIVGDTEYVDVPNRPLRDDASRTYGSIDGKRHNDHRATNHEQLGWTDCKCKWNLKYRRGIVCDPFAGSGTTLQAASELGRDSIGIDLDTRNLELARQRLGMFLQEEDGVLA